MIENAVKYFAVGIGSGFGAAFALFLTVYPYQLAKQALREAID